MEKLFTVPRKGTHPPYICKVEYKSTRPNHEAFRAALAAELDALECGEIRERIARAEAAAPMITDAFLQAWTMEHLW